MYLISFVEMPRAISASGAPSNYAIFPTESFGRRDAPTRPREQEVTSVRRYVFISHTRMSDWPQISKITWPVAASYPIFHIRASPFL